MTHLSASDNAAEVGPVAGSSAVWPRWSLRRYAVMLVLAVGVVLAVLLLTDAPWWTAPALAVCLPAAVFFGEARANLEWVGYTPCQECGGTGKVRINA